MTPLTVLVGIIVLGLSLGRISFWGISFGTSAILFVALAAGHFGQKIPDGFGQLGLAIFVFCVGIAAGPTFFRGLGANGRTMATLGAIIVASGAIVTWMCAKLLHLSADLAGGLMAGAMTSTPALGAISETSDDRTSVAVGFGVAYPIGIVSVVLFVQLALKFFQKSADTSTTIEVQNAAESSSSIQRRVVEIANPGVVGKRPGDLAFLADSNCQVSRVKSESRWNPTPPDYAFQLGEQVLLVGELSVLKTIAEALGVMHDGETAILDADRERRIVVVTSKEIYGKTLKELRMRSRYGVTIARIRRHEIEFVPSSRTRIEFGDTLTLVGDPVNLAKVDKTVGHRPRALNETDLLSLAIGIGVGILVGNFSLNFAGLSISLGYSGGPLAVGLILGHFRRIGPIRGSFPPAAQLLLTEGGLALFLADAGVGAGENVARVVMEQGPLLLLAASAIAVVPMVVGFCVAQYGFRLPLMQVLGSTCGGMTSTPGLAALTGATDSSQPVTSYVAAYPVALVLITVLSPLLVKLLQ